MRGRFVAFVRAAVVGGVAACLLVAATPSGAVGIEPPVPSQPRELLPGVVVGTNTERATTAAAPRGGAPLRGTFRLTAGTCEGSVDGTWFRMIQPGGSASGPFVSNTDSPCSNQTYTPLEPGTDGGLITGTYQPQPDPAFSPAGGGRANRITAPARFYGVNFATATNPTDPQTDVAVTAPSITNEGGTLSGDVRAFAASWNNQHFNQGSPKPDGSTPAGTSGPTGTYDSATGAYTLEWTSRIVGGPFNNFIGLWHLEGTFVPAGSATGSSVDDAGTPTGTGTDESGAPAVADAATGRPLANTGPALPAAAATVGAVALGVAIATRRLLRPALDPVVDHER